MSLAASNHPSPFGPGFSRTLLAGACTLLGACEFDQSTRWLSAKVESSSCTLGARACSFDTLRECAPHDGGVDWVDREDCSLSQLVCSGTLRACAVCEPDARRCGEQGPERCSPDGSNWMAQPACDAAAGQTCRNGSCQDLCQQARARRSNVGCEYWAVDLDNANIRGGVNGAAQQFAVVVSNPQPDVSASVTVELDDSEPGAENAPEQLVRQQIPPLGLHVFPLGPREVDGSPPGEYNTGTHSALTRAAYRVRSTVPVVAYQFNPLDNVDVFSNDASLLKPVEALTDSGTGLRPAYVVLGWPQTIASTDDPLTNFAESPDDELRAYITLVGTRRNTRVRVTPAANVLGSNDFSATAAGERLEMVLQPFDVLNLETDGFNADLTGTLIDADGPIVVFSGSEASDAPLFEELSERQCCADHLEEQLDHRGTAGQRFVAPVSFNRSLAVDNAGGGIGVVSTPETFRVVAVTDAGTNVQTTLSGEHAEFRLDAAGDFHEISTSRDFLLESDAPVMLGNITPSQGAAGVPRSLPGGDPSFLILPPIEQFRSNYVFLTPQFYAFDFLRIIAPPAAEIVIDQRPISQLPECTNLDPPGLTMALDEEDQSEFTVYRCQLSFPVLDTSLDAESLLHPGVQNDGVHIIESDHKIGVLVDGFDRNVSYSYAAGTELEQLIAR